MPLPSGKLPAPTCTIHKNHPGSRLPRGGLLSECYHGTLGKVASAEELEWMDEDTNLSFSSIMMFCPGISFLLRAPAEVRLKRIALLRSWNVWHGGSIGRLPRLWLLVGT
jgi:hypothetical protein